MNLENLVDRLYFGFGLKKATCLAAGPRLLLRNAVGRPENLEGVSSNPRPFEGKGFAILPKYF